MRLQTSLKEASTEISGIRFAPHPAPPQGGRVLVSEEIDRERATPLLSIDGFSEASAYPRDVLEAIDEAIDDQIHSLGAAQSAAFGQTIEELQRANQAMAVELQAVKVQRDQLQGRVGETAMQELRDENTQLLERARVAEEAATAPDAAVTAELEALTTRATTAETEVTRLATAVANLEDENARLRSANEALATKGGDQGSKDTKPKGK